MSHENWFVLCVLRVGCIDEADDTARVARSDKMSSLVAGPLEVHKAQLQSRRLLNVPSLDFFRLFFDVLSVAVILLPPLTSSDLPSDMEDRRSLRR